MSSIQQTVWNRLLHSLEHILKSTYFSFKVFLDDVFQFTGRININTFRDHTLPSSTVCVCMCSTVFHADRAHHRWFIGYFSWWHRNVFAISAVSWSKCRHTTCDYAIAVRGLTDRKTWLGLKISRRNSWIESIQASSSEQAQKRLIAFSTFISSTEKWSCSCSFEWMKAHEQMKITGWCKRCFQQDINISLLSSRGTVRASCLTDDRWSPDLIDHNWDEQLRSIPTNYSLLTGAVSFIVINSKM